MTNLLFTETELKAREILEQIDGSFDQMVIKSVFKAMYHAALTAERVGVVGAALNGYAEPLDVQAGLTSLVKAKVLRSRREKGKTLYEIAY